MPEAKNETPGGQSPKADAEEGGQAQEGQGPLNTFQGQARPASPKPISPEDAEAFMAKCRLALNSEHGVDDKTHREIMDFMIEHDIQPDLTALKLNPQRLAGNKTLTDILTLSALRAREKRKE